MDAESISFGVLASMLRSTKESLRLDAAYLNGNIKEEIKHQHLAALAEVEALKGEQPNRRDSGPENSP